MSFPINLIGDLIAVRTEAPTRTSVLLPDWKRSLFGTVLGKGPSVTAVVEGDRVLFGAALGMDSVLNGQEIRILKQDDIDATYEA